MSVPCVSKLKKLQSKEKPSRDHYLGMSSVGHLFTDRVTINYIQMSGHFYNMLNPSVHYNKHKSPLHPIANMPNLSTILYFVDLVF